MPVDIDLVLLGNERAMESPEPGDLVVPPEHNTEMFRELHDRSLQLDYTVGHNPLNPLWERPGDPLYWRKTNSRMGLAQVYYDGYEEVRDADVPLDSWALRCPADSTQSDNIIWCHVCHDRYADDGGTRCHEHPLRTFDSAGVMYEYPNIHSYHLSKPYWLYTEEELYDLDRKLS